MQKAPIQHLTLDRVRECIRSDDMLGVWDKLAEEDRREFNALASYGQNNDRFDYDYHLKLVADSRWPHEISRDDLRRGLEKLGLKPE